MGKKRSGKFDETGCFSNEMADITEQTVRGHQTLFDLAYDLNRYAQELKYKCDVKNRDLQALMSIGLYFRALDAYSSAIILSENSLGQDAGTATRAALESVFFMKAISANEEFAAEYIKSDQRTRLKFLNIASDPTSALHELFKNDPDRLTEIKRLLQEEVESEQIQEQKAFEVACAAGLKDYYDYAYRILSQTVHPSPRSISYYFDFDSNGEVTSLVYPQEKDWVPMVLFTAISAMILAAKSLVSLFETDCAAIVKFEGRFKLCNEQYRTQTAEKKEEHGQS